MSCYIQIWQQTPSILFNIIFLSFLSRIIKITSRPSDYQMISAKSADRMTLSWILRGCFKFSVQSIIRSVFFYLIHQLQIRIVICMWSPTSYDKQSVVDCLNELKIRRKVLISFDNHFIASLCLHVKSQNILAIFLTNEKFLKPTLSLLNCCYFYLSLGYYCCCSHSCGNFCHDGILSLTSICYCQILNHF